MQVLSAYRPRIPLPVVYPLLFLPHSSPQTVSPHNSSFDICRCMAAGKNRKNYWVRSSPYTDIRTKFEDIVILLKRSKRAAS